MSSVGYKLITLKNLIKDSYDIDTEISASVYYWPMTKTLARLSIKHMAGEDEKNWVVTEKSSPIADDRLLTWFEMLGQKENDNIKLVIYKEDLAKKRRINAVPKVSQKSSAVAKAIHEIRKTIYDLYGVNIFIKLDARVKVSKSIFDQNKNHKTTPEDATEFLLSVAKGTRWEIREIIEWPTEFYGNNDFVLSGSEFQISVRFEIDPLLRTVNENIGSKKYRHITKKRPTEWKVTLGNIK